MADFCLLPQVAEKFKKDIVEGKINPEKLAAMSSKERRAFFAKELGESNAVPVNKLFESKLLLKNKQAGMINWARKVIGQKEPAAKDLISRIKRMENMLDAKSEEAFLEELVSARLGTNITFDEAQEITRLTQAIDEAKTAMDSGGDRLAYGKAVVNLNNYVGDVKLQNQKLSLTEIKNSPLKSLGRIATDVAGQSKSITASLDNSAIFRQGWKTMFTNPVIWQRNALKTFRDIWDTYGGKEVVDELNADIVSRANYDLMKKAKLDVGVVEEAFPSSVPERVTGYLGKKIESTNIPFVSKGLGRVVGKTIKASQDVYTSFVHKTRADVFDEMIRIAKETGVNLDKAELESIGKMVNSLTGRGELGMFEPSAKVANNFFFSPRLLKSQFDVLLQPITGAGNSNFVRRRSALNLLKIIVGSAAIVTIANALKKDSVETDPRSSDFMKIRIGDTRFDVSGGMASVATLISRLATLSSKSTQTGITTELNSGKFGSKTGEDIVYEFFRNKTSPFASAVLNRLKGQDFSGNKPTLGSTATDLFVPLPIKNYNELKDNPNSANSLIALISDGLGVATNTYSPEKDWSQSDSKEMQQFKGKVGEDEFTKANEKFNTIYRERLNNLTKTKDFIEADSEAQKKKVSELESDIKKEIFKEYQFKYKK